MTRREKEQLTEDAEDLARMGYAQELLRDVGGFGNFALSFSIISILTGAVMLYGWGLKWGGPAGMMGGWVLVSLMTLTVAASMAELASAYPTAGALYHWSSLLGGRGWGFTTAWLNTLGQFAITAGIDYGLAEFVVPMLGLGGGRTTVFVVYAGLLTSHGLLNHIGIHVVSILNDVSAWYHMAGTVILVGALALFAPHQPLSSLGRTVTQPGHGLFYCLCIGLLQAQWTFTGYDASAHVTEETLNPRLTAPRGIILAVGVSAIFGFILIAGVTLAIPNLEQALAADNAFIFVLKSALGETLGAFFVWMVMLAMWFCGLSSVTSNSRMLFAFARDGGLGEGRYFAAVSPRFRTPHRAVWLSIVMALVLAVWAGALVVVSGISTIAVYASYGLPIFLALRARASGRFNAGPWTLGRHSQIVGRIAVVWILILMVLFVLPPNELVGYTFAAALVALLVFWGVAARKRFRGPVITLLEGAEASANDSSHAS